MIERKPANGGDDVDVTFVLPMDRGDGQTAVVGDFNDWNPAATPLRRRRGQLSATVRLVPGRRYAFRYLAEGSGWFNDEEADDYEPNPYGGSDSVLDLTAFSYPGTASASVASAPPTSASTVPTGSGRRVRATD